MITLKAIKKATNKRGVKYALAQSSDNTFGVWVLCENYSGHVRGGIAKSWRYDQKGMTLEQATELFNRRAV